MKLPLDSTRLVPGLGLLAATLLAASAAAQEAKPSPPTRDPLPKEQAPPPATAPATAPSTQPVKDLPKAQSILDDARTAMGGKKAVDSIQSLSLKAALNMGMQDVNLEIQSSRDGKFRLHQNTPGMGEATVGYDGVVGWANSPMTGGYQLLDESQIEQTRDQLNFFSTWIVINPEGIYKEIVPVDRTQFNGEECYKVKLVGKSAEASEQFGFFSTAEKLMRGLEMKQESPMGEMTVSFSFADWKPVDDVKLPSKIVINQMGMEVPLTFSEVKLNAVDPTVFDLPAEVKDLIKKKQEAPATQTQPSTPPATTRPAPAPATRPASSEHPAAPSRP